MTELAHTLSGAPGQAPTRKRLSNAEVLAELPCTGKGTLAGEVLRRHWHPLCLSIDLRDLPYPVRMLGEDLVAFRLPDGSTGLVARQCPHRCASLEYAQVMPHGLKCSYHGWTFDTRGRCTEMPLEPADSPLKAQVRHTWYATQEWGGVVWCYMGPDNESPPPLPKLDILARSDGQLVLERGDVRAYSYLNFMENFVDMGHVYVMHMLEPGRVPPELAPHVDMSVETDWRKLQHHVVETAFGMKCVVVANTADPEIKFVNTWSTVWPGVYRFGGMTAGLPPDFSADRRDSGGMLRIIDDTHFEMFRFQLVRPGNFRGTFYEAASDTARGISTKGLRGSREVKDYDTRKYKGWEGIPPMEDYVLQESQGPIAPREQEFLGQSDIGVVLYRRMWRQAMEAVARGETPKLPARDERGVVVTDTFKGPIKASELVLGPANLPTSEDGRGLIRDAKGMLVFA